MSTPAVATCLGCQASDKPGRKWWGWSRVDRLAKIGICIRCVPKKNISELQLHFADCVAANRRTSSKWRNLPKQAGTT